MSYKISKKDYIKILEYYNISIPNNNKNIKEEAETILANKLCSCIKKVGPSIESEPKSIGICTKTIFNNRNMKRGKFTCKKRNKPRIKFTKTKKNISFTRK
uniref:Uncharacterized protein n=1 Tax=viral metagenome TaxID=1070528 RepID=A0A6C0E4H4_9ZZZZ